MGTVRAVALVLAGAFCVAALGGEDDRRADLEALKGQWEQVGRTEDGKRLRVVKDVKDRTETVTVTDDEGQTLHAHAVEFRLGRQGRVRTFTYFNYVVTGGPRRGERMDGETPYAYRVRDDELIEIRGLLEDDPASPQMIVWKRVKTP